MHIDSKHIFDIEAGTVPLDTIIPSITPRYYAASEIGRAVIQEEVSSYLRVVEFAAEIGIPFCVEHNPGYQSVHSVIHEIGHWAVKPDRYIQVYRALSRKDFSILKGDISIEPPFSAKNRIIKGVMYYDGNNDRMPDWDLPDGADPTPGERSTRAWAIKALEHLGVESPIDKSRRVPYNTRGIGDAVIAKGSSFRTWSPAVINHPDVIREFDEFGLNPAKDVFRPPDSSLTLPHLQPKTLDDMLENVQAMQGQHPTLLTEYEGQMEQWRLHMLWKYGQNL